MKLIVQIPCYNEEKTLPETVRAIPRQIEGINHVGVLVIDDGSSDNTTDVAKDIGVDHIVKNTCNCYRIIKGRFYLYVYKPVTPRACT